MKRRFTYLQAGIFVVIATAAVAGIAHWRIDADRKFWREKILGSPLPSVQLSGTVNWPQIPVDPNRYQYTKLWHQRYVRTWQLALDRFRGQPNVNYLEIGAFEGQSLIWMLENILIDPSSRATVIDIFDGPYTAHYRVNLAASGQADRVTTITAPSQEALRTLPLHSFDIIYVDGSHAKADVLEDAVLSWRLLKPGGLMIFDDYQFLELFEDAPHSCAKVAIDPFVQCFQDQCRVIHNAGQLVVFKTGGKHNQEKSK